jgi:hypothetical protein
MLAGSCPPDLRLKGMCKDGIFSAGFDEARTMFGHVLDMQAREDELTLVRNRQRSVGVLLLETWLNDVLTARSAEETPLDLLQAQPSTKRGLVSFGIDRGALLGAGLSDAGVSRLFRGLYVYSVGFSDMLRVRNCHLIVSLARRQALC